MENYIGTVLQKNCLLGNWTVGFGVSESEFIVYYPKTTKQRIGIAHFKKQVDLTLTSLEFQIEVVVHSPHSNQTLVTFS